MINLAAIEEAVHQVRSINVAPVQIHVRAEGFRQLVAAIWPKEIWDSVQGMIINGLPVVVVEDGLKGQEFAVCLIVEIDGPCADARRGAE